MRLSVSRVVGALVALVIATSAAATPAHAGGWAWRGGFAAWYGAEPPVRLGVPEGELRKAVIGLYPYNRYGYNYGGWVAYWAPYEWGHVVRARY